MYGLRARWAKHIAEVAIEVLNPDCPLVVNWAMPGYSPLCKRGVRGDWDVALIQKSPSIPLLQRGKQVEFFNGLFGLNMKLAAQLEFVLAKTQCVQQYPVIEYFRARQIGSCDVDVMIAITSIMVLVRLMQNGRSA
jgi:hypothetical protein